MINLQDDRYGNEVQKSLKETAKSKVESLVQGKKYNKALAYFVSSVIGKRAQNTQWIEVSCVKLEELPATASDLMVRRVLETMPQDLRALLNHAWHQVFSAHHDESDYIKEMLRSLVLTYEDPTPQELAVLTGLGLSDEEMEELHRLIEKCKPWLLPEDSKGKVSFLNAAVKSHLLLNAEELLGMSEEDLKLQHGLLALRCIAHAKQVFDVDTALDIDNETDSDLEYYEGSDDDDNSNEKDDGDYEEEEGDYEEEEGHEYYVEDGDAEDRKEICGPALEYAVTHWIRHASKATLEMADNLVVEHEEFWTAGSLIRRRWLTQFYRLTKNLKDSYYLSDVREWTAIQIVSAFGFRDLVKALIRNGHEGEIAGQCEDGESPVRDEQRALQSRPWMRATPLTQTPVTSGRLLRPYQDCAGALGPRGSD